MENFNSLKKYTIDHPTVTKFVANLIGLGQLPHEIHEMLGEVFSHALEPSQMDDMLDRAKVHMISRTERPVKIVLAESIAFYEGIIRLADKPSDQLRARERIDNLLGLEQNLSNADNSAELAKLAREAWDEMDNVIQEPAYGT